jgi:hypothetical protein
MSDFATLSTHANVIEAEMVRSILADAGIEAFVLNPNAHGLYPGVLGEVKLQVKEEDLEEARQLLEEFSELSEENEEQ